MSNPVLAMDTLKRLRRVKRLAAQITTRSQRKRKRPFQCPCTRCTSAEGWSVSRTSIRASTPSARRACIKREAAIAAPPFCSEVLTMSTRTEKMKVKNAHQNGEGFSSLFRGLSLGQSWLRI